MAKRTDIEIGTWISSTGGGMAVVAEANEFNKGWVELADLSSTAPLHLVAKAILDNLA